MSTIKATNIQHPSAASPNLVLASDGTVSGGAGLGGLVHIATEVVSTGVSNLSFDNCFSSDYENYLLVATIVASSGSNQLFMRFRSGGSDDSSSAYITQTLQASSTSVTGYRDSSLTDKASLTVYSTILAAFETKFFSPNLATNSNYHGWGDENGDNMYFKTGRFNNATQFDGFSLFPGGGTFTGTFRIYGYANS